MRLRIDRTGWAWPLLGLAGSAFGICGALTIFYGNHSVRAGGAIAALCGLPLGLLGMVAWINGYPYLEVDSAARLLHYVSSKSERVTVSFAAIGTLDIRRGEMKSRHVTYYYELRAAPFGDRVLFTSFDESVVEARRDLLSGLINAPG